MPKAQSAAQIRRAEREMKGSKDEQKSWLYERARRIIYGNHPPADDRVRIAVLINGDENIIVHDRVKNEVYQQLREKFPRGDFALMKGTDLETKLLSYAEIESKNNGWSSTGSNPNLYNTSGQSDFGGYGELNQQPGSSYSRKLDVDGLPIHGFRPTGIAYMTLDDFIRAGRECAYDYIFLTTFSEGGYDVEKHNFIVYHSATRKKNVWMRIRFVDVNAGEYLYRNDIVTQGKTGGPTGKPRMMQMPVRAAMEEALNDLEIHS